MNTRSSIIISRSAGPRGPRIPGVFPSSRYGEQVVSTGIPSLDGFLGGGFPTGTVCILKDNFPSRFGELVLKCFVAEGCTYDHQIYVASEKMPSQTYLDELPGLKRSSQGDKEGGMEGPETGLKIAWRYGTVKGPAKIAKGQKEAKFEFKKKTSAAELGCKNLCASKLFERNSLQSPTSEEILDEIINFGGEFFTSGERDKAPSKILRVAISHCERQSLNPHFIMCLRSLARRSNAVCVLSVSNNSSVSDSDVQVCEYLADYVIAFEALLSDTRKQELGGVDGICDFVKMNSLHSLKPIQLPVDVGFSYSNKRLMFQELHIPPEGETTAQRETSKGKPTVLTSDSCGTVHKGKSIDF